MHQARQSFSLFVRETYSPRRTPAVWSCFPLPEDLEIIHIKMLVVSLLLLNYFALSIRGFVQNTTSAAEAELYDESQLLVNDVTTILTEIVNLNHQQLLLLYDLRYKDIADAVTRRALEYSSSRGIFENDGRSTTLERILQMADEPTVLVVLCTVSSVLDIFDKVRTQRLESYRAQWILIFEKETEVDDVFGLEGVVLEGTQILIMKKSSKNTFSLFSNYLDRNRTMRIARRGEWTNEGIQSLSNLWTSYFQDLPSDLNGRRLTVTALPFVPFMFQTDLDPEGYVNATHGIDVSILKTISQVYNFTYRVLPPTDRSWGYPQPDGTISGMVGMVARREADFAIAGIAINGKRESVIDFTVPYYQVSLGIYTRAAKEKNRALAVLSPFTLQVWMSLLLVTLAMGPILTLQARISQMYLSEKHRGGLSNFALNVFRNVVNQGNRLPTQHWPQRYLFCAWYLFCLLVSALYSGTLIAVLAVPAYEKPIDFLTDLARAVEEGYTLTVTGDTTNEYLFKEAKDGIYKEVWGLFNHEDRSKSFVLNSEVGLPMLFEGKILHIGPEISSKIFAASVGREKLHFGREKFFFQNIGIVTPVGVPYKKAFSVVISRLFEGGLIAKFEEEEFANIRQRSSGYSEQNSVTVISLAHLQASFFILLLGFIVATMALFFEILGVSILRKT